MKNDNFNDDAKAIIGLLILLLLAAPVVIWMMHHGPGYAVGHVHQ